MLFPLKAVRLSLANLEDVRYLHRHGPVAATSTVEELDMSPAEFGNLANHITLWKSQKPVGREADGFIKIHCCWLDQSCRSTTLSTVEEQAVNPAESGNLTYR